MLMKRTLFSLFLLALLIPGWGSAEIIQKSSPEAIQTLTEESEVVFRGTCKEVKKGKITHPKTGKLIPVTITSFEVAENLKGPSTKTFEVKQIVAMSRREANRYGLFFTPSHSLFVPGQEYVLFLSEETKFGLRAVSGLGYGKFFVTKDAQGKRQVKHPKGIVGFEKKGVGKSRKGELATEVSLDQFKEQIEE